MKYRTIKKLARPKNDPSPQDDIGMDDVWVKGKYPEGTKKKTYEDMRGYGAATKGRKFLKN
jgi:hypothetical protein